MTDHRLCIWPFGKYVDKEIDVVPNRYLKWVLQEGWFLIKYANLSNVVADEIAWREEHGVKIEDD